MFPHRVDHAPDDGRLLQHVDLPTVWSAAPT
jgi:hypothetical protein